MINFVKNFDALLSGKYTNREWDSENSGKCRQPSHHHKKYKPTKKKNYNRSEVEEPKNTEAENSSGKNEQQSREVQKVKCTTTNIIRRELTQQ